MRGIGKQRQGMGTQAGNNLGDHISEVDPQTDRKCPAFGAGAGMRVPISVTVGMVFMVVIMGHAITLTRRRFAAKKIVLRLLIPIHRQLPK
jgi:hypothetical protein